METSLPRKSALHQLLSDLPIALCEWLRKPMVRGFAHRFGAAWIASINQWSLSENNIRQALRQHKAALSSSPASERSRETMPGCRQKVLYAFFNLSPILIGQRVPELSPLRIRWPLFSSGPLPRCPIIVFAIRVDSSLLTAHPFPCFIEFRF